MFSKFEWIQKSNFAENIGSDIIEVRMLIWRKLFINVSVFLDVVTTTQYNYSLVRRRKIIKRTRLCSNCNKTWIHLNLVGFFKITKFVVTWLSFKRVNNRLYRLDLKLAGLPHLKLLDFGNQNCNSQPCLLFVVAKLCVRINFLSFQFFSLFSQSFLQVRWKLKLEVLDNQQLDTKQWAMIKASRDLKVGWNKIYL